MIRYIKNEEHYNLLIDQITRVKETLWIGTADLKDLYVKRGRETLPLLALLDEKVRRGVALRLIHAKEPGENSATISTVTPRCCRDWNALCVLACILKSLSSILRVFI